MVYRNELARHHVVKSPKGVAPVRRDGVRAWQKASNNPSCGMLLVGGLLWSLEVESLEHRTAISDFGLAVAHPVAHW